MAIRTTFTAGEVLTAADLTDTFGAKANLASPTFTGTVTLPSSVVGAATPNRNLLYNGAHQIAQRGTSSAGITTAPSGDYYTADRWKFLVNAIGTWTQSLEADAPSGSGFRNSVKVLCTTADSSPAAGDYLIFAQRIEGQDLQRLLFGTASAQQLTLSFWVKSNVTGTYIAELRDTTAGKNAGASYSISASATWERKTITFPGNVADVLSNDNAARIELNFWLGAGSNFTSGTLGSAWQSTTANRVVGQTNLAAATNNYWQVTGVQLEVGPAATPFEFKSFGQELRECQRYYYLHLSGNFKQIGLGQMNSNTAMVCQVTFPTTMRSAPNLVVASGTDFYRSEVSVATDDFNSFTIVRAHESGSGIFNDSQISGTSGQVRQVYTNSASASIAFNAEL